MNDVQTGHFDNYELFDTSKAILVKLFSSKFGENGFNTFTSLSQYGESVTLISKDGSWRYSLRFKRPSQPEQPSSAPSQR